MSEQSQQPKRERPSFEVLDQASKEYQELSREASLYQDLIEDCDEEGRAPGRKDYIKLADELKKHHNTVRFRFQRFLAEGYNGLCNMTPGPEAGHKLITKQQKVIEGMCVKRKFEGIVVDDVQTWVIRTADLDDIYAEVIRVNRGVVNVSRSTVERAVRRWVNEHRTAMTLAHKGEAEFEKKHQPKTRNIVSGPNYRRVWDMRLLPILVNNDGIICRVIASAMIDAFSGYPTSCESIPQVEIFDEDLTKKVDFIVLTARRQLAGEMLFTGVRSIELYTDNGAVFRNALQHHLDVLTKGTKRLKIRHSRPGRPQGRGDIENFLGRLDAIIIKEKLPGYLENTSHERIKEVSAMPLLTLDQFNERMRAAIEKERKKPRNKGGKLSREEVWKSDMSYTLPAPPPERLYMFANTVKQYRAQVYDKGVYHGKTYFVPVKRTYEIEARLTALEGKYVPLRLAMWQDQLFAFVCLDDETWTPLEPRESHVDDLEKFMSLRNAVLRDTKKANRMRLEELDALMREEHGGTSLTEFMEAEAQRLEEQQQAEAQKLQAQGSSDAESDQEHAATQDELAEMLRRLRDSFQ